MAKNNVADLLSVGSLFTTQAERDEAQRETVRDIPLEEISDFPNHPFKVRMDESMMEMVDSVKQYGVLVPALVRPKPDGGYEMIAGHRRRMASELAEKPTLSCIVRDMTDDEATIVMVDSNLQREQILPSEKAFAYKLKLDAMKRQGQRSDLTCATPLHKFSGKKSRDVLAEQTGESHEQIRKYVRLTHLIPTILDLVDNSVLKEKEMLQIALRPAVELSYLTEKEQQALVEIMESEDCTPSHVDETALSYSEIKALAIGNPLIIEKCNLDMEVGKLNMLKASYLSQKYALEDMVLKKYPETITRLTERIAGYEQDLQLATAHRKPQEGFAGITILEQLYADKEAAGKAILDVCTKMTGSDAVFLGQYRGFSLVLSYDGPSNEYRMTMKGTLSHTAVLGADVFGNLTRMDNVIDGLSGKLEAVRAELADTQVQLENARTELAAPFAKEAELAEKTARLKELNILLNMDQKDKSLIDDVPDEDTPERSRSKGLER